MTWWSTKDKYIVLLKETMGVSAAVFGRFRCLLMRLDTAPAHSAHVLQLTSDGTQ